MNNENDFEYSYEALSTEERKEVESIKSFYQEHLGLSKVQKLKQMHSKVKNLPQIIALTVGIIGILIFGLGLTMLLEWKLILWGCIVGAMGTIIMLTAYLVFFKVSKVLKAKYSKKIIELSDEILKE